ncbi:hypothetical protein CEXT_348051 [Caerostris extrusa]|uniref:Uncharacterized protein n=1 Tax=Caerostris extrusa TaxID=172846 RepID=A0AAV4XZ85_CAEEX|nr:hypothetical protein CEXT_348051 [Caerostris extrusa]
MAQNPAGLKCSKRTFLTKDFPKTYHRYFLKMPDKTQKNYQNLSESEEKSTSIEESTASESTASQASAATGGTAVTQKTPDSSPSAKGAQGGTPSPSKGGARPKSRARFSPKALSSTKVKGLMSRIGKRASHLKDDFLNVASKVFGSAEEEIEEGLAENEESGRECKSPEEKEKKTAELTVPEKREWVMGIPPSKSPNESMSTSESRLSEASVLTEGKDQRDEEKSE